MHDRDTSHANPLAAPIEREPSDPEATAIEDVRHLGKMARALGRVDGIREERARCAAILAAECDKLTTAGMLRALAAIRSGEAAP